MSHGNLEHYILERLDRIEALLAYLTHQMTPSASLSVDEKARIISAAIKTGDKAALREAQRRINQR